MANDVLSDTLDYCNQCKIAFELFNEAYKLGEDEVIVNTSRCYLQCKGTNEKRCGEML